MEIIIIWMRHLTIHSEMTKKKSATTISTWMIKSIFRDHEPLIAPAPKCEEGDHFYYKEKKLSFTKTEDVYKRALQTAKKGRVFTFHWRGGYLTKAVLEELLELIQKAGKKKSRRMQGSV